MNDDDDLVDAALDSEQPPTRPAKDLTLTQAVVDRAFAAKGKPPKACHYCGRPGGTRDHIVPRSVMRHMHLVRAGTGPGWPVNIVPACVRCNQLKGDKRSDCTCEICTEAWIAYGPPHRRILVIPLLAILAAEATGSAGEP